MRFIFKVYCLLFAALFIAVLKLGAQTPEIPAISELTPETIFNALVDPMYSAVIVILGYASGYIPGLKNINNTFVRVGVVAAVAGLGFFLWKGEFTKILISYFFSSGLYQIVLRNILPTPKPPSLTA